jgi:NADP-reducing hydrogenase subunit HndB
MAKINSFQALKSYQKELQKIDVSLGEVLNSGDLVRVKVAIATCSNAAGAMDVMNFMTDALDKRGINALVTKTGCMGYCYAEPTIEVTLPNQDPVVFGFVDSTKADQIIENYIKQGVLVDSVIPVNYRTVDETFNK